MKTSMVIDSYVQQDRSVGSGRSLFDAVQNALIKGSSLLFRWHELAKQRRTLLALNDQQRQDIGLSRADAVHEGERRFWDDPLK